MSIANEILRLQNAKSALATSIGNKGVTVPASTKLDGYSALVDQIQTGGGGGEGWQRPSNWPDYSKIPMSSIGTDELYMTCDCRPAIAGYEPKVVNFWATAPSGYTVERGYIGGNGFVAVASASFNSNVEAKQILPTDEGDFVVYRVTSTGNITTFELRAWAYYIGKQPLPVDSMPCVEVYGKLENATSFSLSTKYLESVILSLKAVTSLSGAFLTCYKLVNVDTSLWDTSNVTNMVNVFNTCSALTKIDVSTWDTSKVTNMQNMFSSCTSLRRIIGLNELDTSKVENMVGTLGGLKCIIDFDISKWDFSSLTNNTSMLFSNFRMLNRKIEFDESLSIMDAQMMNSSMPLCTAYIFHSVTPPAMANVNALGTINSDAKIYVPDESVNAYKTASNWSTYASYIYPLSEYVEP